VAGGGVTGQHYEVSTKVMGRQKKTFLLLEQRIEYEARIAELTDKHVFELIAANQKLIDFKFVTIEKETTLASKVVDARLEKMNEIREQLSVQRDTFVTKETYETHYQLFVNRMDDIKQRFTKQEGRGVGVALSWGILVAVLTLIAAFAFLFHH